ncbi:peptidyl-prolyl cis-trans isomerase [Bosea caraganae]|uniref:Parvulin-like PPIase n=1 Tax=Bosea caraganae TaxID=2763117 RepID=A0A370LCL0_9HYPH|nr:peptidylprolyl isomerase [Bosea caraganae]RDJ27249.1 peptidyl-prolyl cis-trans isomerase [Bosea caraganae]RDJ29265.1 peptidyl-prolyl cis-trans isomerase [Bosea caraganae]
MIGRLLKEPLVHFLVLALGIFALYGALNRSDEPNSDEIVVTGAKIEQLAGLFAKTRQRPPTASEVKGLVDDHVKEEMLYREALALGLDKDDTVIRRRLRLKMEFLSQAQAETTTPSEADLEAFFKANPDRFRIDPTLAFRQVFLSPERRGEAIEQDVASVLEVLRAKPDTDPATLGDPSILPPELSPTRKTSIGQIFGADFADALARTPPGAWAGPVKSSFGLHVVHVGESQAGRPATLVEVRDSVAQEWTNERRQQAEEAQLAGLLKRYRVRIETQADNAAPTGRSP